MDRKGIDQGTEGMSDDTSRHDRNDARLGLESKKEVHKLKQKTIEAHALNIVLGHNDLNNTEKMLFREINNLWWNG